MSSNENRNEWENEWDKELTEEKRRQHYENKKLGITE